MPKLIFETKFEKDDIVYLIFENGVTQGKVHSVNVYNAYGTTPGTDPRCEHRKAEDILAEIGDEYYDISKPILEYTLELFHPAVSDAFPGIPYYLRVIGSTRMFRKPEALFEYLKRKFEKAYETKINLETKRGQD